LTKLSDLRNRPFLVVNTIFRPKKDIKTHVAGWTEQREPLDIFERPFVVDRISDRVLRDAHVILDITRGAVITSRFENTTDNDIVNHYLDKYQKECQDAVQIWIDRMATKMVDDPKFRAEIEAGVDAPVDTASVAAQSAAEAKRAAKAARRLKNAGTAVAA
jgi:hypothetical protein